MTETYDVLPFSDGNGALYLGTHRSATYRWMEAGYTAIHLYEKDHEREVCHEGWHAQSEKVPEVCVTWITEGKFSPNFWRAARAAAERT